MGQADLINRSPKAVVEVGSARTMEGAGQKTLEQRWGELSSSMRAEP
jgi:hypothetical protein